MLAGPVDVFDEPLDAMSQQVSPHLTPEFLDLYWETIHLLQTVFQTKQDVYISTTSGSGIMDAAIGSLLCSGEKALLLDSGPFTDRLKEILAGYGTDVQVLSAPIGQPVDPQRMREHLRQNRDFSLVLVVGNETGSGVVNPLRELAQVAHEFDLPLFVDGISMVGGMDMPFDDWGIDVCCTVANKGMEAPPGLGIVAVSERAWQVIESKKDVRHHGWYTDLSVWRWYRYQSDWRCYPTTQATNNILALRASLKRILEVETLAGHWARYRRAMEITRKGLKAIGFRMVAPDECASPTVSVIWKQEGMDLPAFLKYVKEEHGFLLAGGVWALGHDTFRMGHMGLESTDGYLIPCLLGIEEYLRTLGRSIPVGTVLTGLNER